MNDKDRLLALEVKQAHQEKIKIFQAIAVMVFVFLVVVMDVI